MSLLSLNCQGAGNASTVRELRDLITKFAPSIFCIQETQINRARSESLSSSLGFDHAFGVDSDGRSGGLVMLWNNNLNIDILGYSHYHIDVSVSGLGDEQ
jgi:exonuclease III